MEASPQLRTRGLTVSLLAALAFFAFSVVLLFDLVMWRSGLRVSPGVCTLIGIAAVAAHLFAVSRRTTSTDPVVWVPIAMLLFYFGMPIAGALNPAFAHYDAWDMSAPRHLDQGFAVALLTLTALLAGIHMIGLRNLKRPIPATKFDASSLLLPGMVCATLGATMLLAGIAYLGPSNLFTVYSKVWVEKASGGDFRLFNVGLILLKAGILAIFASHSPRRPSLTWAALGAAAFIVLLSAQLGDRGGLVAFAVPAAWIYSQRVRRIPVKLVVVGAAIGLLMLPAIKTYRQSLKLKQALQLSPAEAATKTTYEMGTSVLVFGYTLDFIPSEKPYAYGLSYVRSVGNLIPNVGLSPGKEFLPSPLIASPEAWLTDTLNPQKYSVGGGYGYAVGAEWYFNFGLVGVLFGMIATGISLSFFRNRAQDGPAWLVWSALYFSLTALTVRNILGAPLKGALWPMILLLMLRLISRSVLRGRAHPAFRSAGEIAEPSQLGH